MLRIRPSRTRTLGAFGKGFIAPPPGQPITVNVPTQDMSALDALRAEIAALRAQYEKTATTGPAVNLPAGTTASQVVTQGQLVLPGEGQGTKGGAIVEGAGGKTERELLTTPGQDAFMRSTDAVDANLGPTDWRRLGPAPAGYNEAAYLARHPDVADAVRQKAMPSGLWHYLMYGKNEGRALAGWGRRGFAGVNRTRRGVRRPGFLSGIFSNWNAVD